MRVSVAEEAGYQTCGPRGVFLPGKAGPCLVLQPFPPTLVSKSVQQATADKNRSAASWPARGSRQRRSEEISRDLAVPPVEPRCGSVGQEERARCGGRRNQLLCDHL